LYDATIRQANFSQAGRTQTARATPPRSGWILLFVGQVDESRRFATA
jgi:hypothetical protein